MASLTYELNGRNGGTWQKEDIGSIIGQGGQGLKKVMKDSWAMYDRFQKSPNKVNEEKPTVRIVLNEHDDLISGTAEEDPQDVPRQGGVRAEIVSGSPNMQTLCQRALDKHLASIQQQRANGTRELITEFPHRLMAQLIGKGGSGLKRILKEAIYQDKAMVICKKDGERALTARLRIKEITDITTSKGLIDYEACRSNRSFLGWPPQEEDEYEQYISISVSFDMKTPLFTDQPLYMERLSSVITDRTLQLMNDDEDQMDEINECLGL